MPARLVGGHLAGRQDGPQHFQVALARGESLIADPPGRRGQLRAIARPADPDGRGVGLGE